jgi:hypothetical protein
VCDEEARDGTVGGSRGPLIDLGRTHTYTRTHKTHPPTHTNSCPMRKAEGAPAQSAAPPSPEELKGEWGLDTYGTVDGVEAFETFWPFLPGNIKVRSPRR